MMRSSGSSSSIRGRERGKAPMGRNNVLAQIENQKLIASNIAETYTSTSGINTEHPMYKEFMNFIQSRQVQGTNPSSYSSAIADEGNENIEVFDKNEKDEVILLEPMDLQWKDDPWQFMTRYFDKVSYVVPTYKYKMHYEIILSSIGSAEFQHFYPANTVVTPQADLEDTSTATVEKHTQQESGVLKRSKRRSLMEDHKILKAHVDDSIKEVKDSFSKEITEIRNILMEVVSTKVPMGTHRHEPTMEIARQEHLPAATIPRHKPASVELGRFRGDNSEAWIFQAKRYFDFYRIEEDQRLTMALFYLDGEALLMLRLFISGLREDIKNSILSHEPKTFDEALSRLIYKSDKSRLRKDPFDRLWQIRVRLYYLTQMSPHPTSNSSTIVTNNNLNRATARPPLKCLSHAEIHSHRERGLCYYCEEKYTSFVTDDILVEELQCLEVQEHFAISYHALADGHSSSTLRFLGHDNGSPAQVLVDGGSDHNFIQARMKPQGLPPSRVLDHAIHLVPRTNPLNVKLYRYPYFQKQVM
ncbi:hypothetical protein KY284_001119 [Solanum tuberosum]|nr:hypothetical protein KY284_001119 [Solanum tuberosum]